MRVVPPLDLIVCVEGSGTKGPNLYGRDQDLFSAPRIHSKHSVKCVIPPDPILCVGSYNIWNY